MSAPCPCCDHQRPGHRMWLGIDLAKIDEEKEQMLGNLRNLNKGADTQ